MIRRRAAAGLIAVALAAAPALAPAATNARPPLAGCQVVVTLGHAGCVVEQVLECTGLPARARRDDIYVAGEHRLTEVLLEGAFMREVYSAELTRRLDFAPEGLRDFLDAPANTEFTLDYTNTETRNDGTGPVSQQGRAEYRLMGPARLEIGAESLAAVEFFGSARIADGTTVQTRRLYAPEFGAIVARYAVLMPPDGATTTHSRRPVALLRPAETGTEPLAALHAAKAALCTD